MVQVEVDLENVALGGASYPLVLCHGAEGLNRARFAEPTSASGRLISSFLLDHVVSCIQLCIVDFKAR